MESRTKDENVSVCAYCWTRCYGQRRLHEHLAGCVDAPAFVRRDAEKLLTSGLLSNPDPPDTRSHPGPPATATRERTTSRAVGPDPGPPPPASDDSFLED